jgi:hypothetical protein
MSCCWQIEVFPPSATPAILGAIASGDPGAVGFFITCTLLVAAALVADEPSAAVDRCLVCDAPLWRGRQPYVPVTLQLWQQPETAALFAVCESCFESLAADMGAVMSTVLQGCRARLDLPDLRALSPIAAVGHA